MKEITKLEKTSLSDFTLCTAELLHTEESQGRRFFLQSVCAVTGGMTGSLEVNFQILIGMCARAHREV